jgi:hypothetical protein
MRYRRVKDPEYCRIIEGLAPRLTKLGFRRRRESWYRYNRQVVQLVDVRLGHNSHGLRLGLTIRRLNRTTHPSYVECHVRAGLQWLLPREEELVFNAARDLRTPEIDVENMVTVFWRCIQDRVLPILDSTRTLEGIRVLLESDFGRRFQVERVVTESGILRGDALNRRDRPEPD